MDNILLLFVNGVAELLDGRSDTLDSLTAADDDNVVDTDTDADADLGDDIVDATADGDIVDASDPDATGDGDGDADTDVDAATKLLREHRHTCKKLIKQKTKKK